MQNYSIDVRDIWQSIMTVDKQNDKEKEEKRFHPSYQYTCKEQVIVVSSNGLHFAIFREALIRSSQAFATAFSFEPYQGEREEKVDSCTSTNTDDASHFTKEQIIDIEGNDLVVEWFIILINSTKSICPFTNLEETYQLIQLCNKYEVDENIIKVLEDRMEILTDKSPWRWLIMASKLNDREMGNLALQKMGQSGFLNGDQEDKDSFWNRIEKLDPSWTIPILSMNFSYPVHWIDDGYNRKPSFSANYNNGNDSTQTEQFSHYTTADFLQATSKWTDRCKKFGERKI
ncbi:uncharacterized protein L201_000786 [Kwoniella dendrophila CBS 6074]|uniref:BTB domain-containing protein n=1 Tax=Kwoniella dendrophila CBS 6074 TaxID=1295534 RepID=A0AAX4JKL0_9TREE